MEVIQTLIETAGK